VCCCCWAVTRCHQVNSVQYFHDLLRARNEMVAREQVRDRRASAIGQGWGPEECLIGSEELFSQATDGRAYSSGTNQGPLVCGRPAYATADVVR
jgi:hypothetical protein